MSTRIGQARLRLAGFRYFPAIGGAEHLARRLVQEIGNRMTVDVVTLLTENRSDWLRALIDGARDVETRYQVDGREVVAVARWSDSIRRRMRRLAPLYHLPGSPVPSVMGGLLTPELRKATIGASLVHNVFMGREPFSLGLMRAAHERRIPFAFTPLRHERPLGWSSPAFRELYRDADAVIALTQAEARWLISHGARRETVSVIGAGPLSDPAATPDLARERLGPGRFVLFLGQLHDYKGFKTLLGAANRLRDLADLRFVFAGPDVRDHARQLQGLGPAVTYLGSVDDRLRDSLLQACSILCVPSARESFGLVLLEAWQAGKPVIGGPAEATREMIDDGIDGWSVAQDPAVVAARLRTLLENPTLAAEMGARGRDKVARRFSWPVIADAHLAVYSKLLSESRAS